MVLNCKNLAAHQKTSHERTDLPQVDSSKIDPNTPAFERDRSRYHRNQNTPSLQELVRPLEDTRYGARVLFYRGSRPQRFS